MGLRVSDWSTKTCQPQQQANRGPRKHIRVLDSMKWTADVGRQDVGQLSKWDAKNKIPKEIWGLSVVEGLSLPDQSRCTMWVVHVRGHKPY